MIPINLSVFLNLIGCNALFQSLIAGASFEHVDLSPYNYTIFSDHAIEFKNLHLDKDFYFQSVFFDVTPSIYDSSKINVSLSLITDDPKYFENTELFFNEDVRNPKLEHKFIKAKRVFRKDIGWIELFSSPIPQAEVSVTRYSHNKFGIVFDFYHDFELRKKNREEIDSLFTKLE